MSVAVLIVSHHQIGHALVDAVETTFGGRLPLTLRAYAIESNADPDQIYPKISQIIREINQGAGVLLLTDLYGSTPCNICNKLTVDQPIRVVTGLNLPMLVRVMNYPNQSLNDLAETAKIGGQEGIMTCNTNGEPHG